MIDELVVVDISQDCFVSYYRHLVPDKAGSLTFIYHGEPDIAIMDMHTLHAEIIKFRPNTVVDMRSQEMENRVQIMPHRFISMFLVPFWRKNQCRRAEEIERYQEKYMADFVSSPSVFIDTLVFINNY